jgi:DNA-binding IscR family transcriptional regulator
VLSLTRSAKIRVCAIVRALDGPLAPISCASVPAFRGCDHRADLTTCPARLVMVEARIAIANILDNYTLPRWECYRIGLRYKASG